MLDLADHAPRPRLVGIGGRGGAGKTALAGWLAERLRLVTIVHLDDFARPGIPGWDWQRFADQVLVPVLAGAPGRYQRWDWDSDRAAAWHDVDAAGVVTAEGVGALSRHLGDVWDLTVWVEAPSGVRLQRGVARDGEESRRQWTDVWMPEEDACVVIDGTEPLPF